MCRLVWDCRYSAVVGAPFIVSVGRDGWRDFAVGHVMRAMDEFLANRKVAFRARAKTLTENPVSWSRVRARRSLVRAINSK